MVISGFNSLGMPLNLTGPAYLEHVSSVFLFSFRVCEGNWPLCIGPFQFLNSSLYWSPGTIQSLFSLEQVEQLILSYGYVPDQGTKELSSSLYNPPHRVEYIFPPEPSTFSDQLITRILDVSPYGAWLVIIAHYGIESFICIDSCFSYSEEKPWTDWLPLGDNHSSIYWSSCPWSWNSPSNRYGSFNYLLIKYFQYRYINNSLTTQLNCI